MRLFFVSTVCLLSLSALAQESHPPLTASAQANRLALEHHFNQPVPERTWDQDSMATWQQWQLVENFSFGKNRGNLPMIADLNSLHPYFRDKVIELIRQCEIKGIKLAIVETYRTPTKQNEYKSMGRKYTRTKGGLSNHQYGLAVDVVPMVNDQAQWHNIALWRKVGQVGERLGLRWGGRWRYLFDPGHFEWTGPRGTYSLVQGKFPPIPTTAHYPCLEDDLKELKANWKVWEAIQSRLAQNKNQVPTKDVVTTRTHATSGQD
jgi:hypothetical protein